MSSFSVASKLVNPVRTEDVGNTLQRYLQSLCTSRPTSEARKWARSNLCWAEALRWPFTPSHKHNPGHLNRPHKAGLGPQRQTVYILSQGSSCTASTPRPSEQSVQLCSWNTLPELTKPDRTKLMAREGRPGVCIHAKANLQHRWTNWR